jgi:hypothetical protein
MCPHSLNARLIWLAKMSTMNAIQAHIRSLAITLALPCLCHAETTTHGEIQHIKGHHTFIGRLSAAEGCELAAARIRQQAVAAQCGTLMHAGALRTRSESMDDLARFHLETLGGTITSWKTLRRDIERIDTAELTMRCVVEAEVRVQCHQGERDPTFMPLTAKLDQSTYREGEVMHIQIDAAPHARFLTLVQLLPYLDETQQIWRLSPPAHVNNSGESIAIPAHKAIAVPDENYVLEPRLPAERQHTDETLMLITTRQPAPPPPPQMSIATFHAWLSAIPLRDRRELLLPYRIIKK